MSTPVCKVWDDAQEKYVGIPALKGTKGDTGPQGPAGPKGETGAAGAPGKDGADGAGMDITGATIGQIAKITAVDSDGKPTAWSPVDMPTVPTALKNPNALTIKIGGTTVTYDGSAAKTVTIADGSEVAY